MARDYVSVLGLTRKDERVIEVINRCTSRDAKARAFQYLLGSDTGGYSGEIVSAIRATGLHDEYEAEVHGDAETP